MRVVFTHPDSRSQVSNGAMPREPRASGGPWSTLAACIVHHPERVLAAHKQFYLRSLVKASEDSA